MGQEKLYDLVERFWQGQCTEQEEEMLRGLAREGKLEQSFSELSAYLGYAAQRKASRPLGQDFDQRVKHALVQAGPEQSLLGGSPTWLKIAAGLIILLGCVGLLRMINETGGDTQVQPEALADTYDDPEQAYQAVREALFILGGNMNEGMSHTSGLMRFEEATDEIRKQDTKPVNPK